MEKCDSKNIEVKKMQNYEARESLVIMKCLDCGFEFESTTDWDSGSQIDQEQIINDDFASEHLNFSKTKGTKTEILKSQVKEIEKRTETKQIKITLQKKEIETSSTTTILLDSKIDPFTVYREGLHGFIEKKSFNLPSKKIRGNSRGHSKSKLKVKINKSLKISSTVLWLENRQRVENPIIQRIFYFETNRTRDKDNFDISTKPIIDGMQKAHIFKDDSQVIFLPTLFRKGESRVEILLFDTVPPVVLFK